MDKESIRDLASLGLVIVTIASGASGLSFMTKYSNVDANQIRIEREKHANVVHIAATDPAMQDYIGQTLEFNYNKFCNEEISLDNFQNKNKKLTSEKNLEKKIHELASEENKQSLENQNNDLEDLNTKKRKAGENMFVSGLITLASVMGYRKLNPKTKESKQEEAENTM